MPSPPDWPIPQREKEPTLPRLIILDGVSGAGKTAFLNRFLEEHKYTPRFPLKDTGYHTTHFGRCPVEVAENEEHLDAQRRVSEHYMEIIEHLQGEPLIIDRWLLSNIIYGHVYGNQVTVTSGLASDMLKRLDFWYPRGWKHLVFVAKPFVLKERNIGRDREMFMEMPGLKETIAAFTGLAGNKMYRTTVVNTSYSTPETTYRDIMRRLRVAGK